MNEKNVKGITGNGEGKQAVDLAVYGHNVHYAREHGELDAFNESYRLNALCKEAIEETITQNFDGMHLKDNLVQPLAERFGAERMGMILAGTIREACWDWRFSEDNRTWAEGFPIPKDLVWRMRDGDLILDIHSAVLNGFVDMFREEGLGKEQEMAFQIADRYIHLQESEEGYDYSIIGADYKLLDGGVYEDFDIGIREALDAIVGELKEDAFASGVRGRITDEDQPRRVNCESLLENMEAANRIKPKKTAVKASGKTEKPSLRAKLEKERAKAEAPEKPSPKKDRGSQRGEAR